MPFIKFFPPSPPLTADLPPIYAVLAARSRLALPEGPELIEAMLLRDEEALGEMPDAPPTVPVLVVW